VIDMAVPLLQGEMLSWTLELASLGFRPGMATLETTLEWSGSYDRSNVDTATDRAFVTLYLRTERLEGDCWKVSAVAPDNRALQRTALARRR
jgi:hypothetical protein